MNTCLSEGTVQAYLDGQLESSQREHVARHLAACGRCRTHVEAAAARHAGVDALLGHLQTEEPEQPPAVALARFQARVAADRQTPAYARPLGALRLSTALKAFGAAAALLLIAAAFFLLTQTGPPHQQARREPTAAPQPPAVAAPSVARDPAARTDDAPPRPQMSRKTPRATRSTAADPYVLLTSDVRPLEMGMVVRVRMRLSALTPGAMVEGREGTEPEVEADVLVGEDGRARAIRFVNQMPTSGGK